MDFSTNTDISIEYSVHAVIFGADETLLNINLSDGFEFKRLSLVAFQSKLDKIFDLSDLGLRREFETARIDNETLDVICAVKEKTVQIPVLSLKKQYDEIVEKDYISLDNQIRAIRMIKECPLRYKKIAFHFKSDKYLQNNTIISFNGESIIPISEAIRTRPISKFHCDEKEAESINRKIATIHFPLRDSFLNSCHICYDLSYHTEAFISLTLLMTALETLFLEKDVKLKKDLLAKRCSVYLFNDPAKVKDAYNKLKLLYKKRSEFVHDGDMQSIADEDILQLREFVRASLLKALAQTETKKQRIDFIKKSVIENIELFGDLL